MKLLLCAINSQYIHSNPALYALNRALEGLANPPAWQLAEYSINLSHEVILRDLYAAKPDVLACSAYIWNINYLERLLADFHQLLPQALVLLGGPEATAPGSRPASGSSGGTSCPRSRWSCARSPASR